MTSSLPHKELRYLNNSDRRNFRSNVRMDDLRLLLCLCLCLAELGRERYIGIDCDDMKYECIDC